MAQKLSGYHRALDLFEGVVGGVPRDGWDAASPCEGWTARDVAGHVIAGQHMIRALATGGTAPETDQEPGRHCVGDALLAWRSARKDCEAALTPEALRRPIPFAGLGELPLGDYLGGYILEPLVHAWDLGRAAGQRVRLDPDLVHHAFATAHVVAGPLRRAGRLGPALPAPPRADEQTRLLAFLGRDPDHG
ncbi:TIGR03086 family metal-binding protein [Spirillospora sp. CA-294931]|uniref:TIGR03086 family metal-binding protein n=1 Tax=Spirillospora sp. CA-294931 TaxID=3240042 RepID=UPI003D93CD5E